MYDNNHDNNGTYLTIQDVHEDDVQYKRILQFFSQFGFYCGRLGILQIQIGVRVCRK